LPRFTLASLFLLIAVCSIASALVIAGTLSRIAIVILWPSISGFVYVLLNAPPIGRNVSTPFERLEHRRWRRGILGATVIVQMVWLPFGLLVAFYMAGEAGFFDCL
jgi:hypothetical protein